MSLGQNTGLSDPGRKRRGNEDAFVCDPPIFAVADGMGGAQAGELASSLAAGTLREDDSNRLSGEDHVAALIQEANRRVYQRSSEDAAASGMGTTMTVALFEDDIVSIGHVGDSRAYLIRDHELEQLTEDHSLVAELVRSGKLSPEEAETHPQRSVITRALGTDPDVDVDTFSIQAKPGDLFLLCSDGLTSMVDDKVILREIDRKRNDLESAARALIDEANRGGGEDNITVVFFEIVNGDLAADDATTAQQTVTRPVADERTRVSDEEDTLSELDHVPAVATVMISREALAGDGAAPVAASKRSRLPRRLMVAILMLAGLAVACGLALWALWRSHFVGAGEDGRVTVYQGIPYDVVGSVRLYRAKYVSPLHAAQLTRNERRRLFDHDLRSYGSALAEVRSYERKVTP